ncbi:hypothetical protein HPK02_14655 [Anoxybacillus flavithermus]|uniref:hypothetical protein n=1 Tax=Anoxybacillus flavithermus TaxID=33934 RepID=UPI001867A249|nr:hypothetical protein [Anoxybacillus flavithermus]MBE2919991.1 hypothetical protein [Anoxybacillus flavithermus]
MAKMPNFSECQPRFIAFCKAHGLTEGDDFKPYEYIIWVQEKVAEFRKLKGFKSHEPFTDGMHAEFTRFLGR